MKSRKSKPPATGTRKPNMQDSYMRLHQSLRRDFGVLARRVKALESKCEDLEERIVRRKSS